MGENSSDFREALMELVASDPEPADHPSHERWIAYRRGELPAEEEALLAEHLVRCRDCFDLVQAADALFGPAEEPDAGQEEGEALATAALWRLLRPRLFGVREISTGRAPRPAWRFRLPYALAAALFLALLGMTAWNLEQQSALKALRAPRPNVPIVDFSAGERLSAADEKTLTAGSGPWMLVLHPSAELPAYRLTIRDAGTGSRLYSLPLRPDHDLALTFQLPEGLPPGRYRLELQDGAGGGSPGRVLDEYRLRVTAAGRGG